MANNNFNKYLKNKAPIINQKAELFVILVTEDETSVPEYFNKIEEIFDQIVSFEKIPCQKKTAPKQIVNKAITVINAQKKRLTKNAQIWCVFDADTPTEKELENLINKCNKNNINSGISNPCFEIWFLNHYLPTVTTKHFSSKELFKELLKYIANYSKTNNFKFSKKDLSVLTSIKKIERAIKNSKNQIKEHIANGNNNIKKQNPSTQIYGLFSIILEKHKEERA